MPEHIGDRLEADAVDYHPGRQAVPKNMCARPMNRYPCVALDRSGPFWESIQIGEKAPSETACRREPFSADRG